jgi:hypothetical protein
LEYERKLMIDEALTGISFWRYGYSVPCCRVAVIYPLSCLYGVYGCLVFQVLPAPRFNSVLRRRIRLAPKPRAAGPELTGI